MGLFMYMGGGRGQGELQREGQGENTSDVVFCAHELDDMIILYHCHTAVTISMLRHWRNAALAHSSAPPYSSPHLHPTTRIQRVRQWRRECFNLWENNVVAFFSLR